MPCRARPVARDLRALCLWIALLWGCGALDARHTSSRTTGPDGRAVLPNGAALLEHAAAQRRRVGPLVARFNARIQRRDTWIGGASLTGVVAVEPPDRLRVRLFLPAGPTAQDLTVAGDRYRLLLPLEGREEQGVACSPYDAGCDAANPGLLLAWLFTHEPSCTAHGCTVKRHRDGYEVTASLAPEQRLVATMSMTDGEPTMVAEEIQRTGRPSIRVEYSDHRPVAGVRTPYRIEFSDEGSGIRIALDVEAYRTNPALPPETFRIN
jgi:hypothetical protein